MTAVSAMLDGDNGQRQKASNSDEAVMEAKTSYREVTSAGSDLVTAAGIFQYLRENLVPRLEQQGIVVPDLMEEVQQMFENLALADSTRLSVRLGVHYRKVKPMILARLLLYVHEEYRKAYRMLFGGLDESRHVTFQMRRYLAENQRTVYAQALMFAAMAYADEERFGVATGLMVEARRHLIKVIENTSDGTPFPTTDGGISSAAMPSTPNPSMLATGTAAAAAATVAGRVMPRDAGDTSLCRGSVRWLVLNVVDDLLNMYVRNNDQVGLEPVPSRAELQACMPPSVSISKPSPFSWDIVRELARI
ncbi:hypothetical protein EV182_001504 [Spiromyces aspiralis]|uniref:Uncharacterized protein n=1 Tax=Spiromyces aspiralis TaxID=68401 RepID=A0ACC1HLY4_9FUNG|nr:hypothetical protein EV182_001504 [Spiromyces aspiralis]